jgi:hypothetical protein
LLQDLCGFNRFFMDKEEDAVIKLQALADRIQAAQGDSSSEEMQELKAALVDFHGEGSCLGKLAGRSAKVDVLTAGQYSQHCSWRVACNQETAAGVGSSWIARSRCRAVG